MLKVEKKNNKTVDLKQLIKKIPKDKYKLPVIWGKDNKDKVLIRELKNTLLVGKASSGKSTFLHSIINTILLTKTPEEVTLILIDTKTDSFDIYKDIPHLLVPIVKDSKEAIKALRKCQADMGRKVRLLKRHTESGSLEEYNKTYKKKIPYIVIMIDEYSDLLNEFDGEEDINIILGKGDFIGIYIILSTSKYGDDVVSETIMSHCSSKMLGVLPAKMAAPLPDKNGVGHPQGKGDIIYQNKRDEERVRLQTPWISLEDRKNIVKKTIQKFPKEEVKEVWKEKPLIWHTKKSLEDRCGKNAAEFIEEIKLYPIFLCPDDKDNYIFDSLIYGVLKTYDLTDKDIKKIKEKHNVDIQKERQYYKKLLLKQVEENLSSGIPDEFWLEEALMSTLLSLQDRTSIDFAIPFFRNSIKLLPSYPMIADYILAEIAYLFKNPDKRNKKAYKSLQESFKKMKKVDEVPDFIWEGLVVANYCLTDLLGEDNSKDEYIKEIKDEGIKRDLKEKSCVEILFGEDYDPGSRWALKKFSSVRNTMA